MTEEEKGFTIKDRRSFDERGDLKEEDKAAKTENKSTVDKDTEKKDTKSREQKADSSQSPPLPEVNFNSLIFSLSSSALLHIGEIGDPQTGEKKKDLPMAKHSIDIIAMLKDKTLGNLTEEEQKFLDSVLTDLRLRYVKALKG